MEALVASEQWPLAVETLARGEAEGALAVDRADGSIDLHGLTVPVALVAVAAELQRLQQSSGRRGLLIITGRGNHSAQGESLLQPAVLRLLNHGHGPSVCAEVARNNAGRIVLSAAGLRAWVGPEGRRW